MISWETVLSVVLGGVVSALVAHWYFRLSGEEVRQLFNRLEGEVNRLRNLVSRAEENTRAQEYEREFDSLHQARFIFWNRIHASYEEWRSSRELPERIESLIGASVLPDVQPICTGHRFYDWASRLDSEMEASAGDLWKYAKAVYGPPSSRDKTREISSIIPGTSFSEFHRARAELSSYFDRLGNAIFARKQFDPSKISHGHTTVQLMRLLILFEAALLLSIGDPAGSGKTGLLQVYDFWNKQAS